MKKLNEIQLGETSNDTVTVSYQSCSDNTLQESPNVKVESWLNESEIDNSDNADMPSCIELTIKKGQYISDILTEIPTNTIIDKTITGCGMTTMEIEAKRHSIIIVPNVSIVIDKMNEHKDICGVFEDVSIRDILTYLSRSGYRKFICTPEGYGKIVSAFKILKIDYLNEYFILCDESERFIKDLGFREDIIAPFDDFFTYKWKAIGSATPIIFSDPRFAKFNFIKIMPDYDYKKPVELLITNNPYVTLNHILETHKEEPAIFISHNSVNGSISFAKRIGIINDCNFYCSTERRKELVSKEGEFNIYDKIDVNTTPLKKYNFFTSKYYSGLSVKLNYEPVVIILTDLYRGIYSMVDPHTDSVQIYGRYRCGVKKFFHISNLKYNLNYMSKEDVDIQLNEWEMGYWDIRNLCNLSSKSKSYNHIISQGVVCNDYHRYVCKNGDKNYFRYDWRYYIERLNYRYTKCLRLESAYKTSKHFHLKSTYLCCRFSEKEELLLYSNKVSKDSKNKIVYNLIKGAKFDYDKAYLKTLKNDYSYVFEAAELLIDDELESVGYKTSKIKELLINKKITDACSDDIYHTFKEGECYLNSFINKNLGNIYIKYNLPINKRGMVGDLKKYFTTSDVRTNGKRKTKIEKIL